MQLSKWIRDAYPWCHQTWLVNTGDTWRFMAWKMIELNDGPIVWFYKKQFANGKPWPILSNDFSRVKHGEVQTKFGMPGGFHQLNRTTYSGESQMVVVGFCELTPPVSCTRTLFDGSPYLGSMWTSRITCTGTQYATKPKQNEDPSIQALQIVLAFVKATTSCLIPSP